MTDFHLTLAAVAFLAFAGGVACGAAWVRSAAGSDYHRGYGDGARHARRQFLDRRDVDGLDSTSSPG